MVFKTRLKKVLKSIKLENSNFSSKLEEVEEKDIYPYKCKQYNDYTRFYFDKFRELNTKKGKENKQIDSLVPRFFLRKSLFFGYKTLSDIKVTSYCSKDLKFLVSRIENAYIELEKDSKYTHLKKHCLKKALKFMDKYAEDERSKYFVEYIGRRAEAYLDVGQVEKDLEEKTQAFQQAYKYSLKQIEKDESPEALYKLTRICNFFSNLHVNEELKKDKIETGIKTIKKLIEGRKATPITNNILGFLYLKKGDYGRGLPLVKKCLEELNPNIHNKRTPFIYSYGGQALSEAYKLKAKLGGEEDARLNNLENLITGIVSSELSEKFGNKEMENYQTIAREYYDLQYLIGKANQDQAGKITIKKIKEKIQDILHQKNSHGEEIFGKYKGSLRRVVNLEDKLCRLGDEMRFVALEYGYNVFEKSKEKGDDSLDNKSYRGVCLVDMVKINNWLNKFSNGEAKEMLEKAEFLLEEVLKKRDEIKDYLRLSGCKFRLADEDITKDITKRGELYKKAISLEEKAKKQSISIIPEIDSSIAYNFFKLAEISCGEEKAQNLEKAVERFDEAFERGDKSTENRSKKGNCYLELLEDKLKEGIDSEEIKEIIGKTKEVLDKSVEINKENNDYFVYPHFLLYFLSKDLEKVGMNPENFGLKNSKESIVDAIRTYSKNNYDWFVEQVSKSKNLVIESKDNYGLLEDLFLLKKGNNNDLEKEKRNTEYFYKKLKNNNKFFVPRPHDIILHNDEDPNLSGWYYVMSRKKGIVLENILEDEKKPKEEKLRIMKDVVDYLAFIHTNSSQIINQGEDYLNKVSVKLDELNGLIKVNGEVTNKIINNYFPILKSFEGATLVFNKDAHPENWLVTSDKRIGAIDFASKDSAPIEFDLVNLMEYDNYLNDDERKKVMKSYTNAFKKYNNANLFEISELRYLNAVIHRVISLVAAWSVPERESMWNKRKTILNNALYAVNRIKEKYQDYYSKYKKEYENLQEGLIEISLKVID